MVNQSEDEVVWQVYARSVKPLKKTAEQAKKPLPQRLRAHKQERILSYELDLHGYTLDEAYNCLKLFITVHVHAESRVIRVITGKGINGTGKIKNEIMLWMETPFFKEKIRETRWLNDGGVLEIVLKRKKKNEFGKGGKNSSRY